jgi:hypothetical protein
MPMRHVGEFRVGQFSDGELVAYHRSWLIATESHAILLFSDLSSSIERYDRELVLSQLQSPTSDSSITRVLSNLKTTFARDSRSYVYRRTHCFTCFAGLDSFRNKRCIRCGWLICICGACKCLRHEEVT